MKAVPSPYPSPLRYPGGKGALADFFKLLIISNNLCDGEYVEAFAGGASVAWELLFEEYVRRVHINDLSKPIYAFWHSVLREPDGLCKLIRDTPITLKEWRRHTRILANPCEYSTLQVGFSTFFMNRTNRSGILTGGVIGGKYQNGPWKIDARFNKVDLISRIQAISSYSDRIILTRMDASQFIEKNLRCSTAKSLVFFDPPYYGRGEDLYENHYHAKDHASIAKLITTINNIPWVVSYDRTAPVMRLYRGFRSLRYSISYSAQARYSGSEVMFFSENLVIPKVKNPLTPKATNNRRPEIRDTHMN